MQITISGASDDLIEIEGDIYEEFNWYPTKTDATGVLAVSDGTLLRVRYDEDGIWRFSQLVKGSSEFFKEEGSVELDTQDRITLHGTEIKWVVFGEQSAIAKH